MSCSCQSFSVGRFVRRPQLCSITTRHLHQTAFRRATPLAYASIPGPTPEPPQQIRDNGRSERLARRKSQLDTLRAGQAATPKSASVKTTSSRPAQGLLQNRFWREVSVRETSDGLQIMLDNKRPLRTVSKEVLTIPHEKRALASAIAVEWDLLVSAQQALKNHYIPLTSLTSRATDIQNADAKADSSTRTAMVTMLMRYLSTDTLLCWAPKETSQSSQPGQPSLRQTQIATAEPIIAFLKTHLFPGLDIEPNLQEDSILPQAQSQLTEQVIQGWIHGLPAFELAALERGVLATKSLLVAIRLLVEWSTHFKDLQATTHSQAPRFGIAEAARACSVEVRWQTDVWGEVEDTHDVEKEDLARQLGSVIILVS